MATYCRELYPECYHLEVGDVFQVDGRHFHIIYPGAVRELYNLDCLPDNIKIHKLKTNY